MKRYMVVYHAPAAVMEQMARLTPEQARAGMNAWQQWAGRCGPALVDLGTPLANGRSVTPGGVTASKREVCGYSMLQAASLDDAVRLVKDHPHFQMPGQCTIEVHEALPLPGS